MGKKQYFDEDQNPDIAGATTKVVFCCCSINYRVERRCFCRYDSKMEKRGYNKSSTDLVETFNHLAYYLHSKRETIVNRIRAVAAEEPIKVE